MEAIVCENLTKDFNGFRAVNNLNLTVRQNTVFGFLGPNGAGKTTTIRMMVGLLKATAGSISIEGKKVVFGGTVAHQLIGYLPEQPAFYNWMSAFEYLNFTAEIFAMSKADKKKKVSELLEIVNLTNASKKRIGSYSSGMKQRLGIAQAMINDPQVLIMDEPVSALDPIGRREILNIIDDLKKHVTVFMSTHILADVDRVCDEVAILKEGKLIVQSPLGELKEKFAKPILEVEFVKAPANLIAEVQKKDWVDKAQVEGNKIRIYLKDRQAMKESTPIKYFAQKPGVLKYGLVLPDMEDIFIEILEGK